MVGLAGRGWLALRFAVSGNCQLEATVEQLGYAVVGAGGVLPEAGETRGRAGY